MFSKFEQLVSETDQEMHGRDLLETIFWRNIYFDLGMIDLSLNAALKQLKDEWQSMKNTQEKIEALTLIKGLNLNLAISCKHGS